MGRERFEVRQRPGGQLWDVLDLHADGRVIGAGRPKLQAVKFAIDLDTDSLGILVVPGKETSEATNPAEK
jgi:hypothetical protein